MTRLCPTHSTRHTQGCRNRGRPSNALGKTFVFKVCLRQLSFQDSFLHRLLYLLLSCKRCPLQTQLLVPGLTLDSHPVCFCLFVHSYVHTNVFLQRVSRFTRTHAPAKTKPFFVSSVNKNAICQPHIAPVLNHRSHLAPRPFCTL